MFRQVSVQFSQYNVHIFKPIFEIVYIMLGKQSRMCAYTGDTPKKKPMKGIRELAVPVQIFGAVT